MNEFKSFKKSNIPDRGFRFIHKNWVTLQYCEGAQTSFHIDELREIVKAADIRERKSGIGNGRTIIRCLGGGVKREDKAV